MGFTMAFDQEKRWSLRIEGEKYCVAGSPGRVRCNYGHLMEGITIYHTNQIRWPNILNLTFITDNSSRLSTFKFVRRR